MKDFISMALGKIDKLDDMKREAIETVKCLLSDYKNNIFSEFIKDGDVPDDFQFNTLEIKEGGVIIFFNFKNGGDPYLWVRINLCTPDGNVVFIYDLECSLDGFVYDDYLYMKDS